MDKMRITYEARSARISGRPAWPAVQAAIAVAVAVSFALSGCSLNGLQRPISESSDQMPIESDFSQAEEAIAAVSPTIQSVDVSSGTSGLNPYLHVSVLITTENFTVAELDGILEAAFDHAPSNAKNIDVVGRSTLTGDALVEVSVPAAELGIEGLLIRPFSISATTISLAERYGE